MSATRVRWSIAALLLLASTAATAYLVRGHYYTVLAIYRADTPAQVRVQKVVEAFCSELPDYSYELDAFEQRKRVFFSWRDRRWGISTPGYCSTKISRHMALVHYYLHALTDLPAKRVRASAEDIVKAIDEQLQQPAQASDRVRLWCERGFAAHLLGDSFAHTRLSDRNSGSGALRKLYAPGRGHGADGSRPDYMFYRDPSDPNDWRRWVEEANKTLDSGFTTGTQKVGALRDKTEARTGGNFLNQYKEKSVDPDFLKLQTPAIWRPFTDGKIESCQRKVDEWLKSVNDPAFDRVRSNPPRCDEVWRGYLALAHAAFYVNGADPVETVAFDASCRAGSFAGAQPLDPAARASMSDDNRVRWIRSAQTQLTDELKDGRNGD